jgi:HEAT repeat protein
MKDKYIQSLVQEIFNNINVDKNLRSIHAREPSYSLQLFKELLQSENLLLRDIAIHVLLALEPHCGVDLLLPSLFDSEVSWRWYVCWALADYGDERAVIPLTEVLLKDSDSDTRFMAAAALEKIGDRRALPALYHAVQNDSGTDYEGREIRTMALSAIQMILSKQTQA